LSRALSAISVSSALGKEMLACGGTWLLVVRRSLVVEERTDSITANCCVACDTWSRSRVRRRRRRRWWWWYEEERVMVRLFLKGHLID